MFNILNLFKSSKKSKERSSDSGNASKMGNHHSAHQPLERASQATNGFRRSKRSPNRRMDRIRKSFRESIRRLKDPTTTPEANKPFQLQADENAVRSATCAFQVKYLGCVEVYESRGTTVCDQALKILRNARKRPVRAILHISGDGLRVVDDETKDLIVDQTIEKVSFCAPDRNNEKGFSYICRDGTTRRWMCHGFTAIKESGERLSHAVGCAFHLCLERKQQRDKECGVTMTFDQKTSTFVRQGSFRQPSLTEQMQNSQERAIDVAPPVRQIYNPYAIERPHATPSMLERQGSFRGFNQLNQASPFKRQLSLKLSDLPSNLERTRSHSLEPTDLSRLPNLLQLQQIPKPPVSPIPEIPQDDQERVLSMCQELSRGLSLLSHNDDFAPIISQTTTNTVVKKLFSNSNTTTSVINSSSLDDLKLQNNDHLFSDLTTTSSTITTTTITNKISNNINNNNNNANISDESNPLGSDGLSWQDSSSSVVSSTVNHRLTPILNQCGSLSPVLPQRSVNNTPAMNNAIASIFDTPAASPAFSNASSSSLSSNQIMNRSPVPPPPSALAALSNSPNTSMIMSASPTPIPINPASSSSPPLLASSSSGRMSSGVSDFATSTATQPLPITSVQAVPPTANLPNPDQWLGSVTTQVTQSAMPPPLSTSPRRAPPLHSRAMSLGSASLPTSSRSVPADPFDAEWAEVAAPNLRQNSTTNPFIMANATQAFQVQL